MKWDITRTWTSADPKLPLTDFRLLEPRLFWSGGLNVKRAFEGIVTYIDTESRVLWSRSGNLLNPNIFEKLVRDLAQKLKDQPY